MIDSVLLILSAGLLGLFFLVRSRKAPLPGVFRLSGILMATALFGWYQIREQGFNIQSITMTVVAAAILTAAYFQARNTDLEHDPESRSTQSNPDHPQSP
jgi:hypothetical protein